LTLSPVFQQLLTPVLKSYCAELGTSELPRLMEALGGQGYMLENQFGRLIADAQVERIWEGYVFSPSV
jgi:alkylation response protein AidB-like acyl-CoA dehydrogenase